jgi:hypothetical protein
VARSIIWPQVGPPAEAVAPDPGKGLDVLGLAAAFGPELARRMGIRVTAVRARDDVMGGDSETAVLLGSVPLASGGAGGLEAVHAGCAPEVAALLLERLFGARASDAATARGADLAVLPPGSASWVALCRTVSTALAAALGSVEQAVGGSPRLPSRAHGLPGGHRLVLSLDVDGHGCAMLLLLETARPVQPAPPAPDVGQFRRAALARAFDLELPVALRIAERRMSLEQFGQLAAGDIIPIDPLQTLDVLAAGRRIARLPARAFIPPAAEPGPDQ